MTAAPGGYSRVSQEQEQSQKAAMSLGGDEPCRIWRY